MGHAYKLTEKAKSLRYILVRRLPTGNSLLEYDDWTEAAESLPHRVAYTNFGREIFLDDGYIDLYTKDECLDAAKEGCDWPLEIEVVELVNIEE